MTNKEDSSFLQGVESRLDSLFGEDSGSTMKDKGKEPVEPKPALQDIPEPTEAAPEVKEDIREIPIVKTPGFESAISPEKTPAQDKSTFISEIEKRFSAIFGEDEKEAAPVKAEEKPLALEDIELPAKLELASETVPAQMSQSAAEIAAATVAEIPQETEPVVEAKPVIEAIPVVEEPKAPKEIVSDFVAPLSSIYNSPLKDIKSIVLSIEWEISDHILEQFDEEVNKLYLLYTGNRIIQGFLRILRFLGRYIRVRGVSSNQDSINMLLSVYDHLETVMITEGMTEARKHIILLDNIKKYRAWVETTDIEAGAEALAIEPKREEVITPVDEPAVERKPLYEIPPLHLEPSEAADEAGKPELPGLQLEEREAKEPAIREAEIPFAAEPAMADFPVVSLDDQNTIIEAMKSMPLDEAVKYAVEEIKNIYQAELDALKDEIRILKGGR